MKFVQNKAASMRVRNSKSDSKSEWNFSVLPGSRCSGGRTLKFFKFQGVFVFHFPSIVSIAAALIIAVPCDLPLACSQPSLGPAGVRIVPQPEHHRSQR